MASGVTFNLEFMCLNHLDFICLNHLEFVCLNNLEFICLNRLEFICSEHLEFIRLNRLEFICLSHFGLHAPLKFSLSATRQLATELDRWGSAMIADLVEKTVLLLIFILLFFKKSFHFFRFQNTWGKK